MHKCTKKEVFLCTIFLCVAIHSNGLSPCVCCTLICVHWTTGPARTVWIRYIDVIQLQPLRALSQNGSLAIACSVDGGNNSNTVTVGVSTSHNFRGKNGPLDGCPRIGCREQKRPWRGRSLPAVTYFQTARCQQFWWWLKWRRWMRQLKLRRRH